MKEEGGGEESKRDLIEGKSVSLLPLHAKWVWAVAQRLADGLSQQQQQQESCAQRQQEAGCVAAGLSTGEGLAGERGIRSKLLLLAQRFGD